MDDSRHAHGEGATRNPGCIRTPVIPVFYIWLLFTLMYFFTEDGAFPVGKWEFVWRFFAGPFNFLF